MRGLLAVVVVFIAALGPPAGRGFVPPPAAAAQLVTDPRFILQTQAGLAAYAQLTTTIPLNLAAGVYVTLTLTNDDYLLGDYQLSGRSLADAVKLMIHREGWAVAFHPPYVHAGRLLDWLPYDWQGNPGFVLNLPEQAIGELAAALGVTSPTVSFADFRNPSAEWVYLHWMLKLGYGTSDSTLMLPLLSPIFDRGYGVATNGYTAQFWLNGEIVQQVAGGTPANQFRWGELSSSQLRSGYTNALEQKTTTFFTSASSGGVGVVGTGGGLCFAALTAS